MKFIFAALISASFFLESQEVDAGDILFLKVQELESEISSLRSELEAQAYLIDKLLNENQTKLVIDNSSNNEVVAADNTFRFEGINDEQSIDEVYDQAISQLNDKNFEEAKRSFVYLADNFTDDEKIPLSLFWLGEISLLESDLEKSETFFQLLAINHPDHWRTP